ncbi:MULTISPECIES: hypothetical protein [Cysteiniphilum]|uniref:hypothetical protein n=1 Tax=Cysteiniphilum TaxID=2056696 RepID=UPI00177F99ED|nr:MULTISPECIES: hypothetical protein [Cysteiniphilum]
MAITTKFTPLSLICLAFIQINHANAEAQGGIVSLCADNQVSIWKSTTLDPGNAKNGSISFDVSQATLYLDISQSKAIMESIHSNAIEGVYNNGQEDCSSGKICFQSATDDDHNGKQFISSDFSMTFNATVVYTPLSITLDNPKGTIILTPYTVNNSSYPRILQASAKQKSTQSQNENPSNFPFIYWQFEGCSNALTIQ